MTIITAYYTEETNVAIAATADTGNISYIPSYPSGTYYDKELALFLENGGVITPYDPYHGVTDEQLREQKYTLNANLAQEQINAAEATPVTGTVLDARKTNKENKRRVNRAKRNTGMTDADDAMADHVDSVYDVLDQADDEVENLDRAGLIAWDGSTIVWPVWTPPAI